MREVEYVEESNPWSIYTLDDGNVLRVRTIIIAIRYNGEIDSNGVPIVNYDHAIIAKLDKPKSITKDMLKKDT